MVKKQINLAIKAWVIAKSILLFLLNKIMDSTDHKDYLHGINNNQGAYHAK